MSDHCRREVMVYFSSLAEKVTSVFVLIGRTGADMLTDLLRKQDHVNVMLMKNRKSYYINDEVLFYTIPILQRLTKCMHGYSIPKQGEVTLILKVKNTFEEIFVTLAKLESKIIQTPPPSSKTESLSSGKLSTNSKYQMQNYLPPWHDLLHEHMLKKN